MNEWPVLALVLACVSCGPPPSERHPQPHSKSPLYLRDARGDCVYLMMVDRTHAVEHVKDEVCDTLAREGAAERASR